MGSSVSKLRVENNTKFDLVTSISEIDNFDFMGNGHPSETLDRLKISAKSHIEKEVNLYSPASNCPITMKLNYTDGSVDEFKINLQWAHNKSGAGFCRLREDHHLSYRLEGNRIVVTVKHTPEQLDEEHAKDLMSEAESLIQREKFDEALNKLEMCQKKTHSYNFSQQIEQVIEKVRKLKIENHADQKAETMLSQINDLITNGDYDAALNKLHLIELVTSKPSLLASIPECKAKIKNHQGEQLLQKAIDAENDLNTDRSEEATRYYQQARDLFKDANTISSNWDFRRNLTLIDNKMEGNDLFNFATELDTEASELLNNCQFDEAEAKLCEALQVLEEAEKRFQESHQLGEKAICDIQDFKKVIEDSLQTNYMQKSLSKVKIDARNLQIEHKDYKEEFYTERQTGF